MRNRMKDAVVTALIVAAGYMALGAATASAAGPYAAGTMFIADQNCPCLWQVPPGGTSSPTVFDAYEESPQDVAVDAAGDVYWTQLENGTIDERPAGGADKVLATGFTPFGIAVDGSGDVYFGTFSGPSGAGLYEIPTGGSPTLITSRFGAFSSLATDGNGDIWGVGDSDNLVVVPPGTSGEEVNISGVSFDGVRLDGSNDLFASTAAGDSAIELTPGSVTAATVGTISDYADGVAVDGSGDVFLGHPSGEVGFGQVSEIPSGGSPAPYASGIADSHGLALYPPLSPASRSSASITLTSPTSSPVTTETTVPLTATVPSGEPGGVQFDDNGRPIGDATNTSGGTVSTTTHLTAGTHDITATYLGDGTHAPAISGVLTFTSTAIPSKTVIGFPGGTTIPGDQQLTVDASVTGAGGVPSGYVTFYDGSTQEGSANLDSNGNASIQFSAVPGVTKVYGVYSGDSTFAGSTSPKTTVTTTTPYVPTLSTTVKYGTPNSHRAVRATIKLTVSGVKVEPAPTGTVSADSGFTCGALTPVTGTDKSVASCSHMLPAGTFETVNLTFTTGDSNYDSGATSVFVGNDG
jgi:hypothetical protein